MIRHRFLAHAVTAVLAFFFVHPATGHSVPEPNARGESYVRFSAQANESVVVELRSIVPPEQAVANGQSFPEVVLYIRKDSGEIVTDPSLLPRITIPGSGSRYLRFSAIACGADGDNCTLKVEGPDGTHYEYPNAMQRKFGRVIIITSFACETTPCGPGIMRTATIVGANGDTRAQDEAFIPSKLFLIDPETGEP